MAITTETDREAFLARLTTTAYQVALRHGIKGSFADLELSLWHALRNVCEDNDLVSIADRANQFPPPGSAGGGQGGGLALAESRESFLILEALAPRPALPPQSRGEGKTGSSSVKFATVMEDGSRWPR